MKIKIQKQMALFLVLAIPLIIFAESGTIKYSVTYNNNKLILRNTLLGDATYTIVSYNNLNNDGDPGVPSLPVDYIKFSVPFNASNFNITATYSEYNNVLIDNPISPCQYNSIKNETVERHITPPDSTYYYSGNYFPLNKAWIVNDGFIAGENRVITVALMPVSYRKRSTSIIENELQIARTVDITMSYDIDDSLDNYPLISKKRSKRNEGYKLTKRLVVNPESVIKNAPTEFTDRQILQCYAAHQPISRQGILPPLLDDTIEVPANYYTIITPDSLKTSLKRLAALKSQKGYVTSIVTVESIINQYIMNNPSVNVNQIDSAKVIREFLKSRFYNGEAGFFLMAGKDVPFKSFKYIGWPKTYPTDQYYCDLTSNWNTSFDYCPDVYVGRIIARRKEQISNYTDKLMRYELNPGKGDYSYLKRGLYTNGYDMVNVENGVTATEIVRAYADSIYTDATVFMEDRVNETPSGTQIINEFNNSRYGFINFNNHGIPMGISVYGRGGSGNHLYSWIWAIEGEHAPESITSHVNDDTSTGNGLNNMTNKYYPSVCFSSCCFVMPFDIPAGYESASMLFGESFTTGKDYGGPAFLGNTRDNGQDMVTLGQHFFKFIINGFPKIGMAQALSKTYKFDALTNMIYNLLGDPEFELWTDTPQVFANINVTRTDNSITVTGIDSDSTIVAYCGNDGSIGADTTSVSSIVFSGISPNSTIMLYRHDRIPYIAPLELQNITFSNNQYVIASDVNAGYSINNNRTNGNVIVPNNVEYEIEASGKVTLEDGFKVEKGATFAVYPSCY